MTTRQQDQSAAEWEELAPGYDRFATDHSMTLGAEALRLAGLRSGQRFLDVGCGTGGLAIPAARLGADVLATDIAPGMVERLRVRVDAEGLSNLRGRVMDGHALDLDEDRFDVSGSQFGVVLFPDLSRALREMVRVTKPGGRVLLVCLGPPPLVEFTAFFLAAMRATVPGFKGFSPDGTPPPFQVSAPERLRGEMAGAGLRDVRIEPVTWELLITSAGHLWNLIQNSHPIGAQMIRRLTDEQATTVRSILDGMLRESSGGAGPAVLANAVQVGVGRK